MSLSPTLTKPPTATAGMTGLLGLLAMIAVTVITAGMDFPANVRTLIVIGSGAAAMIAYEFLFLRTYRRETTGLDWSKWSPNLKRTAIKLFGLLFTLTLLASLYILFPEYEKRQYIVVWNTIRDLLPYVAVFAVIYMFVIDAVMTSPKDTYYQVGLIALGRMDEADLSRIPHHIRSWLIKGFFIPLMFSYLTNNFGGLPARIDTIDEIIFSLNLFKIFGFLWVSLLTVDLAFTVIGYLFSFRLTDTHERSAEPTMLGWVVALMCYQPFWSLFEKHYLDYFTTEPNWENVYNEHPVFVGFWGAVVILLTVIYAWSTVAFGMRFSNLTHRGIITSGPYRFTKHPAYISKNLSWWLLFAPFMAFTDNFSIALQNCILLLMVNGIYYLRAMTEERHLSQDPVYRDYQAWIAQNGLFRKRECSFFKRT